MQTTRYLAAGLMAWLLCAGSGVRAQTLTDGEITRRLVGTWVIPPEQCTDVIKGGATTFKADGTFTSFGSFSLKGQPLKIEVEGKWRVEKGNLVEETTRSSHPQMVPVGLTTRDTILEITDARYRYRPEKGPERFYLRQRGK